jgi:tRNA(fMet)-specific endonuclease VapC
LTVGRLSHRLPASSTSRKSQDVVARSDPLDRLLGGGVSISRITVAELYEGAFHTVNPDASLHSRRGFLRACQVLDVTDAVAEEFAELRAYLRRRGERLDDLELFIAASALQHNLTLLTFDRRTFDRVPHLRLYEAK